MYEMEARVGLEIPKSTKSSLYSGVSENSATTSDFSRNRRICIVGNLGNDGDVVEAAQSFGVPVLISESGSEYLKDDTFETFYILDEFSGPVYDMIHRATQKILGPTALKEYSMKHEMLPDMNRPLYCQSMCGLVLCFTGFRRKEDLAKLISLIHHMGGSIRKDLGSRVTHLIANCCGGDKYQYAQTFRVPIMSEAWVHHCWERRTEPGLMADHEDMMSLRLKPFHGARVCFLGFSEEEKLHMEEVLVVNGGTPTDVNDSTCSHVVVDGGDTYNVLKADLLNPQTSVFATPPPSALPTPSSFTPVFLTPARPSVYRQSMPGTMAHVSCSPAQRQSLSTCLTPNIRLMMEENRGKLHTPVVDELNTSIKPESLPAKAHIVRAEWFWASVQNEGVVDERDYLFEDYLESVCSPAATAAIPESTPSHSSRLRKRKRLKEAVSRLAPPVPDFTSPPSISALNTLSVDVGAAGSGEGVRKRRSSVSDAAFLSMSEGSFLDCTASPNTPGREDVASVTSPSPRKILSPAYQVFMELVQTESNYVGILHTIMTLFKSPLEDALQSGKPLLNNTELKIIFGNFPPIYDVHKLMLEELIWKANHWREEHGIGKIILKYAADLLKAYPPYVNFFENMKEMLCKCDESKPRFHAFLKVCQTKPECGRQSLQELLIRPVQRLPSISLLLNDILKHTPKNTPDYSNLEKALCAIREVMTLINEDKRKTEGQMVMFDIFNEIDHCPAHLLSSHRNFVQKCEVIELSDGLSGKGDQLVLFLFSDTLEVCKKRSKAFRSMRSPSTSSFTKLNNMKPYKHVKLLPLSHIKRVVDVRETEDCRNVFALVCRSNQELKERLFSFTIIEEEPNKGIFLKTLCRQMANTVCKADAENFLTSLDPHHLEISTSDVVVGTLGKAFKFASRTRMKVGRALSFSKSPNRLKRPSTQPGHLRLASCNNLTELGTPKLACNVRSTRKINSSSLSVASLRML